jgi:transcriptional antiterminator RfaH
MLRWYLVYTKASGESVAQANLERQKYEVYFPRLLECIHRAGRRRQRLVALFPRYLFLHLDEGRQPLDPVHSTLGVATVVRFNSRYALVPDGVILDLRARADPNSGLHVLNTRSIFAPGSPIAITSGPFSGIEGVFERQAGAERVVVLLKLLGRDAPVRIPADFVLRSHPI